MNTPDGVAKMKATILKRDPDFYRKIGAKGGKAKVPKGFSFMDKEKRREITRKGGRAKNQDRQSGQDVQLVDKDQG